MQPDEILRLDRRKCIALFQGRKPALLYKLAPEELPDYSKLKPCKVIDYTPAWRRQEEQAVKPPAAKAVEQQSLPQEQKKPIQENHTAESQVHEVEQPVVSDTAGLGMVEVTIGSICGEDEDSPPGR